MEGISDRMKIVDNKCTSCGAVLEYNIDKKKFICKFCRKEYENNEVIGKKHNVVTSVKELICPNCRAVLIVEENVISSKCIYCLNNVIVSKSNDNISTPEKIILFSISKEKALYKLESSLYNKKLLPKRFDINKSINDIVGVYVPFWLYSNEYKVNIKYKNDDINSTFNNTAYGVLNNAKEKKANIKFKLIPFDANKHLSNKLTKALEPFDYSELIPFDTAYLSGFLGQKYDVESNEGISEIEKRCNNTISNVFNSVKSKYYIKDIVMINNKKLNEEKYYALLPIWLVNIEYHKKNYFIAINGQTGKIAGSLPIDKNKYRIITLASFIIIFIILMIIVYSLRWGGLL